MIAVFSQDKQVVIFNRRSAQNKNTRAILAGGKAEEFMAPTLPGGITEGEHRERKTLNEADLTELEKLVDFADSNKIETVNDPWEDIKR